MWNHCPFEGHDYPAGMIANHMFKVKSHVPLQRSSDLNLYKWVLQLPYKKHGHIFKEHKYTLDSITTQIQLTPMLF